MTILDALAPTVPAMITDDIEGVLAQNAPGIALLGRLTDLGGFESSFLWHWFTDGATGPSTLRTTAISSPAYVADFRAAVARRGPDAQAQSLVDALLAASAEFRDVWALQEVAVKRITRKVLLHARVGRLDLECDVVVSPPSGQHLVLFRARPGTGTAERLAMLAVLGTQEFARAD